MPANATPALSPRQRQLCRTIQTLTEKRGFPPTLREAAECMGVHWTRVSQLAASAAKKGVIHREPRSPRTMRVIAPTAAKTRS